MKRELIERPNQTFQTSAARCQAGPRKWTRSLGSQPFPKVGEATKGIAVKESINTALKIESRSVPACNTQENQKTTPANEKMPCIAQGQLMRNITTRKTLPAPREGRLAHRNTSSKTDQKSAEITRNAQFITTERRKNTTHSVRESNTGGSKTGCTAGSKNSGEGNRVISSVVLSPPEQHDAGDYLPPLNISRVNAHNSSTYSRLLALMERRQFEFNPRIHLDWRRLLTRDGFHPSDAREIPTAGEVALQRSKTWEDAEPIGRIRKCAKYTGPESRRRDSVDRNAQNQFHVRYTPRGLITVASQSPLTSTHHFYSISSRLTESRTQTYWPKSDPTPPPMRWSYTSGTCFAPPVTPSSPLLRSSPTRQWRPQSMIGRESALEDIEETETCLGELDKDEGIGTPSTEDSIDDLSYFL